MENWQSAHSQPEMLAIIGNLTPLIWRVVYTVLVATTAYAQTKGIRL